jgi:hypothetical protein
VTGGPEGSGGAVTDRKLHILLLVTVFSGAVQSSVNLELLELVLM